jgi:hypothetical protein
MKTTHKKRNIVFLTAVPAITLILGFMWAGCSNPAGGGSPPPDTTARYSGESGGTKTDLDITTKASGEMTYVLIVVINGETVESRGTVVKTGDTYTFKASTGESFTAALGDGGAPVFNAPLPIKDSAGNSIVIPPLQAQFDVDPAAYSGGALTFTKFSTIGSDVTYELSSAGLGTVKLDANGKITVNLVTPSAGSLWDFDDYKSQGYTVSPAGVKGFAITGFITPDEKKLLWLPHKTDTNDKGHNLEYIYAAADVTVKGTTQEGSVDLTLKQGWNLVEWNGAVSSMTTGKFSMSDYIWKVSNIEVAEIENPVTWKKGAVTLLIAQSGDVHEGHTYYPMRLTEGGNTKTGSIRYYSATELVFTGAGNNVSYLYAKDADTLALLSCTYDDKSLTAILDPAGTPHVFTLTGENPNLGFDGTYTASSSYKLVITGKVLTLYYSETFLGGGIFTKQNDTTIKLNDLDVTGTLSGSTLTLSGSDLSGLPNTWTK